MQSLDVISVNLWQILISLCNLVIIFLVVKHFLYQPVRKMLKKRQETLDGEYAAALNAGKGKGFVMDVKCFFGTIVSVLKSDGVVEGGTGELKKKEDAKAAVKQEAATK